MSRLLDAAHRRPVDRTPVWFMRQAGRYMPEYRALRQKHPILDICMTAELAAEVTLQPLTRFTGLDAGIIFSDILVLLRPMGIQVEFIKGEGPSIANPIRSAGDVDALRTPDPGRDFKPVYDAIRIVKKASNVPLLGFAGAPFTLASYLVEGGPSKDFTRTKALMATDAWPRLMERLADAVTAHLRAQAAAGADMVQLFDSWVGHLTAEEYRRHVQPYSRRILRDLPVPSIHFGTQTAHLLELMRDAGGTVVGVDARIPLDEAWTRLGDVAVQGNLDPQAMLLPREELLKRVDDVLARARNRPGHIFNLGHGLVPETPMDSVQAVIDHVHARTAR
ncbi:MAG TPA: uroporphyrinogen decarboxylase [Planctomycetota bacterium]|nr:uroporphyrinogen decarboxylase [Planctomycetota bacterium]